MKEAIVHNEDLIYFQTPYSSFIEFFQTFNFVKFSLITDYFLDAFVLYFGVLN